MCLAARQDDVSVRCDRPLSGGAWVTLRDDESKVYGICGA